MLLLEDSYVLQRPTHQVVQLSSIYGDAAPGRPNLLPYFVWFSSVSLLQMKTILDLKVLGSIFSSFLTYTWVNSPLSMQTVR